MSFFCFLWGQSGVAEKQKGRVLNFSSFLYLSVVSGLFFLPSSLLPERPQGASDLKATPERRGNKGRGEETEGGETRGEVWIISQKGHVGSL